MNKNSASGRGQDLLAAMGQVPVIIPGTLSERRGTSGKINGWKLQRWKQGGNETRYIPVRLVDRVRDGTAGYERFMALAQEYVEYKGEEALAGLTDTYDAKKKPTKR